MVEVVPAHLTVHGGGLRTNSKRDSESVVGHLDRDEITGAKEQKLFVNRDANQASGFSSNKAHIPLKDTGLPGLQFLSKDMGVYVQVITGRMLAKNPELAALANKLSGKLDELLEASDSMDTPQGLAKLAAILSSPEFAKLGKFEAYMLLYEYMLKKKRENSKKKGLAAISAALDEMEGTATLDLVEGLKGFHQEVEAKLNLIDEFKSSAASYHGEYSDILTQIDRQYAGEFKSLVKDLIKLNAHNSQCADLWQDKSRAYEQQAFMLDNMHFETKLLNLMSVLCKFEGVEKQLPEVKDATTLKLTSDFIDLLDGFDCNRLISAKCKNIADAGARKAAFYTLVNSDIEILRYLSSNFFKQSGDREQLNARLKRCVSSDEQVADGPFAGRHEYF